MFGTEKKSDESDSDSQTPGPSNPQTGTEYDELLVDVRNYVAFGASVDGQATTNELIEAFQHKLPTHQTAIFKAMLSKVCVFSRSSTGEGLWYLKEEFR